MSVDTALLTNTCTTAYKTRWEVGLPVSLLERRIQQQRSNQKVKPKYNRRAHRSRTKATLEHPDKDIRDCTTESHRTPTIEVHSMKIGRQSRAP